MGTYYNELRNRLILAAVNVNSTADEGDVNRNHNNFGKLTAFATVIEDFGDTVCVTKTMNVTNGCYSITQLKIDDKTVIENSNCIV